MYCLGLLVEAFVPEGPLVVGIDETLEDGWTWHASSLALGRSG